MALDGITLFKIREDLKTHLPLRINKILETSKTQIVFGVHSEHGRTSLVLSFHSNDNHIYLSKRNYQTYSDPSTFVMVLRKYILNGLIYDIEQSDYDRYLLFRIRARDELYDEKEYTLSCELMGKYANLILINDQNRIIDALKKIPPFENNRRTILPNVPFLLPEKQDKKDPFTAQDIDFDESLVAQLQGFSRLLENEVRFRMGNGRSFSQIMEEIKRSDSLYVCRKQDSFDFHVIELSHLDLPCEKYPLQEGFETIFYEDGEKDRIRGISDDLFKVVRRQLKHYDTKIKKLEQSLEDALNLQGDKENGELLYLYEDLDRKGLKEVQITDYEGNTKTVPLDPRLSVKANAAKYYNQYQKKRKGKVYIEEQLEQARNELTYFESLNEQLSMADYADALDIKEELSRFCYLRKNDGRSRKKKKINLYQIKIDGHTITFGKNNLQNAALSFDYARPNHTWFHAKQYHGSHVTIDTDHPDEKLIRICANLAAWYSKGRYSSSVPVDYCLVKELKKIKGGKPGFVTFRNYKTIYIDPEEDKESVIAMIQI